MNRRSLFGKLLGAVVGVKVAPEVIEAAPVNPLSRPSELDMLFIGEADRIITASIGGKNVDGKWWRALSQESHEMPSTLDQIIWERSGR